MWVVVVGKLCVGAALLGLLIAAFYLGHGYERRHGLLLPHVLEMTIVALLTGAALIALVAPW